MHPLTRLTRQFQAERAAQKLVAGSNRALGSHFLHRARIVPQNYTPTLSQKCSRFWGTSSGSHGGFGPLTVPRMADPRLAQLEAALFVADEPLTLRRLTSLLVLKDSGTVRTLLDRLSRLLDDDGSPFQIEELAGGYQLRTRAEYHPHLAILRRAEAEAQLSPAARETLTIIAYRQPVTRADIEAIRGVGSADVLRMLMDRQLVRIAGRDQSLGRPQLYATTTKFLQWFGLRSLADLPPAEGLSRPMGAKGGSSRSTKGKTAP